MGSQEKGLNGTVRPRPYSMKKKTMEKNNIEVDLRKDKHVIRGKRAVKIYNSDSKYRYLFICIADLSAKLFKSDIEYLKLGEIEKIRLVSKRCPSLDSLEDQRTLLCKGIARRVFPRDSDLEYNDIDVAHYAYWAQDRIHKKFLFHSERLWGMPKGASPCHQNLLYPMIGRNCMQKSFIKQLDVTVQVEITVCPF